MAEGQGRVQGIEGSTFSGSIWEIGKNNELSIHMHVFECSMWAYAIGFVLHGSSTVEDSGQDSRGHPQQIHMTNATSLLRLLRLVNLFDC